MKTPVWLSRFVLQVVLGLCILFVLKALWSIYAGYASAQNPILPEELGLYIAFPNVAFVVMYSSIGYIAYKLLQEKCVDSKFLYPLAFLIILELGKLYVYAILQEINPFG